MKLEIDRFIGSEGENIMVVGGSMTARILMIVVILDEGELVKPKGSHKGRVRIADGKEQKKLV